MHHCFSQRHEDHHGRGHGGRRGGRIFGHGGLRLVVLSLIADKPAHGYELIKEIEERLQGSYSPSPGVIYPTLTWLEELGYIEVAETEGGRKRYMITDAGREYLKQNEEAVNAMLARLAEGHQRPPQAVRAIENLKMAIRLRLSHGRLSAEQADAFADILDEAAKKVERL